MSDYRITYPWGDAITVTADMPGTPIEIDGAPTPLSSEMAYGEDELVRLVTGYLGREWYGFEDGDREDAIDGAIIESM